MGSTLATIPVLAQQLGHADLVVRGYGDVALVEARVELPGEKQADLNLSRSDEALSISNGKEVLRKHRLLNDLDSTVQCRQKAVQSARIRAPCMSAQDRMNSEAVTCGQIHGRAAWRRRSIRLQGRVGLPPDGLPRPTSIGGQPRPDRLA